MPDQNSSRRDFMKTSTAAAAAGAVAAQNTQAAQAPGGVEADTVRAGEWPSSRPLKRKVLWNEMARSEFPDALKNDPVVILPIGSLEQHGPHCPVDMDISIPYHIAVETAEHIDDFPVIVGPPVWTGFTHYNMGGYGTITVRLETFIDVVCDVCRSIKANGFDRIVLMNEHGGNVAPVTAIANKLAQEDIMTLSFPYWNLVAQEMRDWSTADGRGPGHGGGVGDGVPDVSAAALGADGPARSGEDTLAVQPGGKEIRSYARAPPRKRQRYVGRSVRGNAREGGGDLQVGGGAADGHGEGVSFDTGVTLHRIWQRCRCVADALLVGWGPKRAKSQRTWRQPGGVEFHDMVYTSLRHLFADRKQRDGKQRRYDPGTGREGR